MTDNKQQRQHAKTLIHTFYNDTTNIRLQKVLKKAYTRLEVGVDVSDLAARAVGAVNYICRTDAVSLTFQQEAWVKALQNMGAAAILHHDPKNNLLDLSEM